MRKEVRMEFQRGLFAETSSKMPTADVVYPRRQRYTRSDLDGYEAKPEPKELWIVPGAAHALSYKENKQEYTDKVRKFVGQYIH